MTQVPPPNLSDSQRIELLEFRIEILENQVKGLIAAEQEKIESERSYKRSEIERIAFRYGGVRRIFPEIRPEWVEELSGNEGEDND